MSQFLPVAARAQRMALHGYEQMARTQRAVSIAIQVSSSAATT